MSISHASVYHLSCIYLPIYLSIHQLYIYYGFIEHPSLSAYQLFIYLPISPSPVYFSTHLTCHRSINIYHLFTFHRLSGRKHKLTMQVAFQGVRYQPSQHVCRERIELVWARWSGLALRWVRILFTIVNNPLPGWNPVLTLPHAWSEDGRLRDMLTHRRSKLCLERWHP